jgi:tetratricopeptide (TPR) repeat protein
MTPRKGQPDEKPVRHDLPAQGQTRAAGWGPSPGALGIDGDPAEVLWQSFLALAQQRLRLEQYLAQAAAPELAQAATPESVARLVELLRQATTQFGPAALLFAAAVERHAAGLNNAQHPQLAVGLYQAVRPLFENHAPPEMLADILYHEAFVWWHLCRFAEAVTCWDRVVEVRQRLIQQGRTELVNGLASALLHKGNALLSLGKLAEATAAYDRAIEIRQGLVEQGRTELTSDLAKALWGKGNALQSLGKLAEAIAAYDRAIDILQGLVDQGRPELASSLAAVLVNKGNALSSQGKLAEATAACDGAIGLLQGLVDQGRTELANDLASALLNKGNALQGQGKLAEAVATYDRAIAIRQGLVQQGRSELANGLAKVLMNKGNALQNQGQLAEATAAYDCAVAILNDLVQQGRTELVSDLASTLMNKGGALSNQGRLAEAIATYDRVIAILHGLVEQGRTELANDLANALLNKGNVLHSQGTLAEAAAACDRAIEILHGLVEQGRTELANNLAAALLNKGNALQGQGKLAEAVTAYDRAIAIRQGLVQQGRSELANDLASTLMNKGVALHNQGKLAEAVAAFDRAIAIWQKLVEEGRTELANDLASALMNKGNALRDQGDLEVAFAIHQQLSADLFSGDDRRKYHSALADLLWDLGQREQALEHLARGRQVLRQARRLAGIDETALEYVAQREGFIDQCVRCALELTRHAEAFAAVQDGKATVFADLLSRLSGQVSDEPGEVVAARQNLTDFLRQPLQRSANLTEEAIEQFRRDWQAELKQRTDFYLRAWRLARHDILAGAGPQASAEEEVSLSAIQASLQPGWAILDFWRLNDDTITLFAVTRGELAVHTLPFPINKLRRKLERLLRSLGDPLGGDRNDEALNDLHAFLFAPLLPWLSERQVHGLYLVPHGFLHALPLHAARTGSDGYLCDEFHVAYLPSAALLPQLKPLCLDGPVFSLANPERGTAHTLPFADWEGEQLQQRFGSRGGAFHRGPDARLERTTAWGEAALLHFSCHGSGHDAFAPLSHLRLADDLLLAHDVMYRRPPLHEGALVTLNGCQTAVRDVRAHNESMGLMTAFLLRGASLVLATQWSVEDRCAAEMVLAFLEQMLNHGTPPTDALRLAQRQARQMTADDVLQHWDMIEKGLPDDSAEKGKLLAHRAWLCHRAGRSAEARHYAALAAPALRHAGLQREAERTMVVISHGVVSLAASGAGRGSFDHPVFWAAFQLVGRVV